MGTAYIGTPVAIGKFENNPEAGSLAKEGISIDILREESPDIVTFPPQPIFEVDVDNSTAQSERDRRIRNEQLKNAWLNKCQKIDEAGILCGNRPWKLCDTKTVSLT